MRCTICKTGTLREGVVTVTFDRKPTLFVMREVPARVCDNCGAYTLESAVAERVLLASRDARAKKSSVEIMNYEALVAA
jgi:YgiT-type zinc finger domain-containing protein